MWHDKNRHSMHYTDNYLHHSSSILPVWLNGWVLVYELNGYGWLFVAKFSDWLSCVQHIDLNTFKNKLFNIQQ